MIARQTIDEYSKTENGSKLSIYLGRTASSFSLDCVYVEEPVALG